MSFRVSTLITAGLLGALFLVGSISPVLAEDGCEKDRKDSSMSSLRTATVPIEERIG